MLNKQLLNVKDLYVDVEDKEILHGVDLSIGEGAVSYTHLDVYKRQVFIHNQKAFMKLSADVS